MKTINLSNFGLQGVAPLSRAEMKGVLGGSVGSGTCCLKTDTEDVVVPDRDGDSEYWSLYYGSLVRFLS